MMTIDPAPLVDALAKVDAARERVFDTIHAAVSSTQGVEPEFEREARIRAIQVAEHEMGDTLMELANAVRLVLK